MDIFLQIVQYVQPVNFRSVDRKIVHYVIWVITHMQMSLLVLHVHLAIMEVRKDYPPRLAVVYVLQGIMETQLDKQVVIVMDQQQKDFILLQVQ